MTGPWHYGEAERLLAEAAHPDRITDDEPRLVWMANAHATLALAAAAVMREEDRDEWDRVAGRLEVPS